MIGRGKEKKSQETIVIETVKDIVITVMLASILLYGEWISGIKRGKTTGNFAKKKKKNCLQQKIVCKKPTIPLEYFRKRVITTKAIL